MFRQFAVAVVVLSLGLVSCTTTGGGRKAKAAGFLGDYGMLEKGDSDQAQLRYLNTSASFRKYSKVMIDPIEVWAQKRSKLKKLPKQEVRSLITYLDASVRRELGKDYQIVTSPGADVMRVRIAITEAKGANVALNMVSSVVPVGLAISTAKKAALGTHTAVGEAAVEIELLDSKTGERLAAAIDVRSGRKIITGGNFSKWGDVQDAYDYWTAKLRVRLKEWRLGEQK